MAPMLPYRGSGADPSHVPERARRRAARDDRRRDHRRRRRWAARAGPRRDRRRAARAPETRSRPCAFDEIRVHSRRPERREAFAARLCADLGRPITVVDTWEACVRDADVVVEASRLTAPAPLLRTEWIRRGACVIPYGTMSAVEPSLTDIMDKIVVDDWGQATVGPFGALRAHVQSGRLSPKNLHAEMRS